MPKVFPWENISKNDRFTDTPTIHELNMMWKLYQIWILQKCGHSSSEHVPSSPLLYVRAEEQGLSLEKVFKYSCLCDPRKSYIHLSKCVRIRMCPLERVWLGSWSAHLEIWFSCLSLTWTFDPPGLAVKAKCIICSETERRLFKVTPSPPIKPEAPHIWKCEAPKRKSDGCEQFLLN